MVRRAQVDTPQATTHLPVTRAVGTRWWDVGLSNRHTEGSSVRYILQFVFSFIPEVESLNLHRLKAGDTTPSSPLLSPVNNAELDLEALAAQVQEFFGIERTVAAPPTPIIVPTFATVPIPIAVPSPPRLHQAPPRGLQKAEAPTRWGRIKKFLISLMRLRDMFGRANREPVTLSRGLVPELDENAEIMEKRYVGLL